MAPRQCLSPIRTSLSRGPPSLAIKRPKQYFEGKVVRQGRIIVRRKSALLPQIRIQFRSIGARKPRLQYLESCFRVSATPPPPLSVTSFATRRHNAATWRQRSKVQECARSRSVSGVDPVVVSADQGRIGCAPAEETAGG